MFPGFAVSLAEQSDTFLMFIGILCVLIGFELAQVVWPGAQRPMHRVRYWVCMSGLFFGFVVISLVWTPRVAGNDTELLGHLYVGGYGAVAVLGFFSGRVAHARSVSICGSGKYALAALVPGLNFVFLVYRPSAAFRQDNKGRYLRSGLGIVTGAILTFFAGSLLDLRATTVVQTADKGREDAAVVAMQFASHLARSDLADVPTDVAAAMPEYLGVDVGLMLKDISSTPTTLLAIYEFETESPELPDAMRHRAVEAVCGDIKLVLLLQAGALVH